MIVYRINDETIPSGTQFWLPATVAKYFTRDVVDVELLAEKETPEIEQRADELRAEAAIMNYADDAAFHVGEEITFEGYADDCGDPIAAVDFSLDGGETWTTYETAGATAERWVYWNFSYAPQEARAPNRAACRSWPRISCLRLRRPSCKLRTDAGRRDA